MRVVAAAWLVGATVIGAAAAIHQWYPDWQPEPMPAKAQVQIEAGPPVPDDLPPKQPWSTEQGPATPAPSTASAPPAGSRGRWTVPVTVGEFGAVAQSAETHADPSAGDPRPEPDGGIVLASGEEVFTADTGSEPRARGGDTEPAAGDGIETAAAQTEMPPQSDPPPRLIAADQPPSSAPPAVVALAAPKLGSIPEAIRAARAAPDPHRPQSGNLSVARIDYDEAGAVVLGGSATPGSIVRVRLDGESLGEAEADAAGQWSLRPDKPVATGQYELQAEEVGGTGLTVAAVSLPFAKAENIGDLPLPDRLVVQPGNNLWRLAERLYSDGFAYVRIFEANRGQIEDPDLIFPGQIFRIPPPES